MSTISGQSIQIGPFIGGLNTFSDDTSVADNELTICENFELDLDGSLKSRPSFVDNGVSFPLDSSGGNLDLLGYFYDGIIPYLIGSDGDNSTYYFNGTSWTLLTNTFSASALIQFDNKAWMTAAVGSANPGGYWTPVGGFTAVANMPKGDSIIAHKFRLWVIRGKLAATEGTRLFHSETLGTSPFWKAAPDFIDIGTGDGQNIVQLTVYYNNLLIFRSDSIYSLQYTSDPGAGVVSLLVPGVGLSSKDSIALYENYIYFMYDGKAYEFSNSRSAQINIKVPFTAVSRTGMYLQYAVSVFNNRIIFSYFDTLYVFNLRTRTWSTWKTDSFGPIGKFVTLVTDTETETAIVHSSAAVPIGGTRTTPILFMSDAITDDIENFVCTLQTKNFNYEASSLYKKLFYWGIDAMYRGKMTATVTPVSFNYGVTWGNLRTAGITWGSRFLGGFSWAQPSNEGLSEVTVIDISGSGNSRKFTKFKKGLRFRQVQYRVSFETDGSFSSAPVRVFSLMTRVKAKEQVSKTIT